MNQDGNICGNKVLTWFLAGCWKWEKWQRCPGILFYFLQFLLSGTAGRQHQHSPSGGVKGFGTNGQTKQRAPRSRGVLCVQWPVLIVCSEDKICYFSFLFSISFPLNLLSKPNMLLLSCMLYMWLLKKRKLMDKIYTNPSSANSLRPGGHDRKRIRMTSSFTAASSSSFLFFFYF